MKRYYIDITVRIEANNENEAWHLANEAADKLGLYVEEVSQPKPNSVVEEKIMDYGIRMHDGIIINDIGLYYVTREYGGPEEGGWYYDHYTLKHSFFIGHMPTAEATAFHDALVAWEESMNENAPSLSSVLSTGRYQVMFEYEPGEFQTTRVPTYG